MQCLLQLSQASNVNKMFKTVGLGNDRLGPDVWEILYVAFSVDQIALTILKSFGNWTFALCSWSLDTSGIVGVVVI